MDMESAPTRRQLLALVSSSSSVIGSAGCLDSFSESDSSEDNQETSTPAPTVPDVDCDPDNHPSLSTEPPEGAWTPTRGNQRRTGANHDMEPLGLDDVDELQTTELFRDSSVDLPAVADGTLYVDNGKTYAIDVETGETEWSRYTQAVETPLVTQDTVYIAAGGAQVHSIDRNQGEFRWSTTLDQDPPTDEDNQTIRTVPVVVEGNVIVGVWSYGDDERGWFTALDARCGSKRWSIGVSQESPRGLATDGQTVYAATDHHLYALDAEDGTQHWRVKVTDEDLDSDAPPALEGETVILKGSDLTALATADGSVRWTRDLGVPYPPTVTADSIYVVEDDTATVHALDIETGETRWTVTDLPEELETSLTYVSDKLYSRDRSGALIVLDATTGEVHSEGELEIKSSGNVHRLAITPDGIFTRGSPTEGQKSDVVTRFTPN